MLEKDMNKDQMTQPDQHQQQLLLTSLLSQLVQGMKNNEKNQIEGMLENQSGKVLGKESHRKDERGSDGHQRVDKGAEQGSGLEMKKQGGRSSWQQGFEESKKNFDRFSKQVCGKCKDPRDATKECGVGHCLIYGRDSHITGECNLLKQVKPVPKYVGYAAKGLGILLV